MNQIAELILNRYFFDQATTDIDYAKARERYIQFCSENFLDVQYIYDYYMADDFDSFSDHIPTEKTLFYEHICKIWVEIETSPRDELTKLLKKAFEDLQKINKNLEICESKKQEWKEKFSTENLRKSYQDLANLYITRNKDAQERIVDFLSSRQKVIDHIKQVIFSNSGSIARISMQLYKYFSPYRFYFNVYEMHYDPTDFSELRHKFSHVFRRSQEYKDLIKPFYEKPDNIDERCLQYDAYIKQFKITEEIENRLSHLRLQPRRQAISTCLTLYSASSDLNSFIGLSAIQIEGCFGDFCKKIIDLEDRFNLGNKVDAIQKSNILHNSEYEYFRYIFPARVRNQVAHGELISPELLRFTSALILLDLNCVTDILCRPVDQINWMEAQLLRPEEPTPIQDIASIFLLHNIESLLKSDNVFCENWILLLKEHQISLDIEQFLTNKIDYIAQKSIYWIKIRRLLRWGQVLVGISNIFTTLAAQAFHKLAIHFLKHSCDEHHEHYNEYYDQVIQLLTDDQLDLIFVFEKMLKYQNKSPEYRLSDTLDGITFVKESLFLSKKLGTEKKTDPPNLKGEINFLAFIDELKLFFRI